MSGDKSVRYGESSKQFKSGNIKLNAEAQEWYPANHRSYTTPVTIRHPSAGRCMAQNRLQQIRSGATNASSYQTPESTESDFQYLQALIARISADPGQFEEMIDIFMQTLNCHLNSMEMLHKISDFVFAHAIEEPSFRYNAARLCKAIQDNSHLFESHLNELCVKEVGKNRQRPGFTLFLAELYTQSNVTNWKMLYDVLNKLVALGGHENVKTVCQTLKLSGHNLEAYNKRLMEDLLQALETQLPYVQRNIAALIESVLTLRTNAWGRSSDATPSQNLQTVSNPSAYVSNDSIFYGPCGEELSETEQLIMDGTLLLDDPDELYNPEPEMDEEIQAAFKEFVKLSK